MAKSPRARPLAAFGLNVRQRREALGLSQLKAAEKADLDPTYISGIERGVRNPSIKAVLKLTRALRVGVEELCEGVRA